MFFPKLPAVELCFRRNSIKKGQWTFFFSELCSENRYSACKLFRFRSLKWIYWRQKIVLFLGFIFLAHPVQRHSRSVRFGPEVLHRADPSEATPSFSEPREAFFKSESEKLALRLLPPPVRLVRITCTLHARDFKTINSPGKVKHRTNMFTLVRKRQQIETAPAKRV